MKDEETDFVGLDMCSEASIPCFRTLMHFCAISLEYCPIDEQRRRSYRLNGFALECIDKAFL